MTLRQAINLITRRNFNCEDCNCDIWDRCFKTCFGKGDCLMKKAAEVISGYASKKG